MTTCREQELNQALEAMHFGFRAMVYKPDIRLAKLGYARVHHRLLYFIGRNPDCSIGELLKILSVSKQYLHRPLKTLLADGYINEKLDANDKRVKRLKLSTRGRQLEQTLSGEQRQRFARIFEQLGPDAEKYWHQVMKLLAQKIEY